MPESVANAVFLRSRAGRVEELAGPLETLVLASRSATPTATSGYCRRSRPGFPGASTLVRLRSVPQETSRARFGARRLPTASMRNALARQIRTGLTGMPSTWCASRPAKSCRNERHALKRK
jgi:hypothetical protein